MATKIYRRAVTVTVDTTRKITWSMALTAADTDTAGSYCVFLRVTFDDGTILKIKPAGSVELWKDDDAPDLIGEATFDDPITGDIDTVTLTMNDTGTENLTIAEVCA